MQIARELAIRELRETEPYYPHSVACAILDRGGERPTLLGVRNTWERYRFQDGIEVICTSWGQVWSHYPNYPEILACWKDAKTGVCAA